MVFEQVEGKHVQPFTLCTKGVRDIKWSVSPSQAALGDSDILGGVSPGDGCPFPHLLLLLLLLLLLFILLLILLPLLLGKTTLWGNRLGALLRS